MQVQHVLKGKTLLSSKANQTASSHNKRQKREDDLVLMHVPYNFGNTVEKVALLGPNGTIAVYRALLAETGDSFAQVSEPNSWEEIESVMQPGGEAWGHINPDLQVMNNITNCPHYLSPAKYWPEDLAQSYFGNKTIFGIIRDPYEKLVAQFRGGMADYGGFPRQMMVTCDVNAAIKGRMKELLQSQQESGNMFQNGCAHIPQAEYFEGPYGIQVPVDNWRFPLSMNELFEEHGYTWRVHEDDIMHVELCEDHWSVEFDDETRSLVQQVYQKDFDLLCQSFGYCNVDENACLQGVFHMCPESKFSWDSARDLYCPKAGVDLTTFNVREREECS